MSPTRAAGSPMPPSVDPHEGAAQIEIAAGRNIELPRRLDDDLGRLQGQAGRRLDRDTSGPALNHEAIALSVVQLHTIVVDREPLAVVQLELRQTLDPV